MRHALTILFLVAICWPAHSQLDDAVAFVVPHAPGDKLYHIDSNDVPTLLELPVASRYGLAYDSSADECLIVQHDTLGGTVDDFWISIVSLDGSIDSTYCDIGEELEFGTNFGGILRGLFVTLATGKRFYLGYTQRINGSDTVMGVNVDATDPCSTFQEHTFTGEYLSTVMPITIDGTLYVYFIFENGSGKYANIPFTGFTSFDSIGGFVWPAGCTAVTGASFDGTNVYVAGAYNTACSGGQYGYAMLCGPHGDDPDPENWSMEDVTSHVLDDSVTWLTFRFDDAMHASPLHTVAKGAGYYLGGNQCSPTSYPWAQNVWTKENDGTPSESTLFFGDCSFGGVGGTPDQCGLGPSETAWFCADDEVLVYSFDLSTLLNTITISGESQLDQVYPVR